MDKSRNGNPETEETFAQDTGKKYKKDELHGPTKKTDEW